MSPVAEDPASSERRWFEAVEELFIRLRGAPLLLSPKDYRIARGWRQQGISFLVVEEALEEIFRRRRERGATSPISSLSYCASKVEAAWEQARELSAPAVREASTGFAVTPRLRRLTEVLTVQLDALAPMSSSGTPSALDDARGLQDVTHRLAQLAEEDGEAVQDPELVESRLEALDGELLEAAESALSTPARQALDHAVGLSASRIGASSNASFGQSLSEDALRALRRRALRRQLNLPVLSLFAPEADEPAPAEPRE